MVKFDDILSEIDEFGRFQKSRYALICLAALLPPICTYLHAFIAAKPLHRCTHPDYVNDSYTLNATAYYNSSITFKQCTYIVNNTEIECDKWVFDRKYYKYTLTEEWSMVCNRSVLRSSVQTIYFIGYLIGSLLFGVLADRIGRRPVMLASFVIIILGSAFATFGPQKAFGVNFSYASYTIGRFLTAIGTRGINVIGYVLALELVGPDKRTMAGIFFKYFFAFGQFLLVLMAYFIRDWRVLSGIVLACGFPFLTYFIFIPESMRWLVSKGRLDEALTLLKKVCEVNKTHLKEDSWKEFLVSESNSSNKQESLLTILKSPILASLLLVLSLNWCANNFLFYGLGLKANDLGLNPYLTYAISVACELLGYIVIFVLISKYGRKVPYFFFQLFAGLCCFAIIFIADSKKIVVMAMLGKFFSASTYAVIQLYSSEMFPTSLRNSCMGVCSMIARLGPIAAPMVNNLGDKQLPFLVFGISGVFAAASTLLLPETKDRVLPQNIAETEKLFAIRCKCIKKIPKCLTCKL